MTWLGAALVGVVLLSAYPQPVLAAQPECVEAPQPVDNAATNAANSRINALRAQWAAGVYPGPNPFSGTTTTNGKAQTAAKAKEAEINLFVADFDKHPASTGVTVRTGQSLKDEMARMARAGHHDRVSDLQRAYANWEQNVAETLEAKQQEARNLYAVVEAVRARFDEEIAGLEQQIADQRDRTSRTVACASPRVPPRPQAPVAQRPQPGPVDDGAPRIKSLDEQISDCYGHAEAEIDVCLANLVLLHEDPRPCGSSPTGQCAVLVGEVIMGNCANAHQGPDVLLCETLAAEWMKMPGVCEAAQDREACILAVAAKTIDPYAIIDSFQSPAERDRLLSVLATTTGSLTVIAHIEDNRVHDGALILSAYAAATHRNQPLQASYCDRLMGGYGGEYGEEDADINRTVCGQAVQIVNTLLAQESQSEQPLTEERLALEYERLIERLRAGDAPADDLMDWMRAD